MKIIKFLLPIILVSFLFAQDRPDIARFDLKFMKINTSPYSAPYTVLENKISATIKEGDTVSFGFNQFETEDHQNQEPWEEWLNIENNVTYNTPIIIPVLTSAGQWIDDTTFNTNEVIMSVDLDAGYWEVKVRAVANPGYYETLESNYSGKSEFFKIESPIPEKPLKFRISIIVK